MEGPQLLGGLGQGALGTSVEGHLVQAVEGPVELFQNLEQLLCLHDDRVAVHQEYPLQVRPVVLPGHVNVLQNLLHRADAEFLLLVHPAEGALIVGTADGALEQVALPLPRRTVQQVAVVTHKTPPLFVPFFFHKEKGTEKRNFGKNFVFPPRLLIIGFLQAGHLGRPF